MSLLLSGDLKLSKPTTSSVLITPQTKVPVDPLIGDVSLLLHGDGTNGAQNNTFLDSSTNNFTITRNGNTTQGSFSPFGKVGGSGYFDGNGDYLSAADNTAFAFGTGNFTWEMWVYRTSTTTLRSIIDLRANGFNNTGLSDYISANEKYVVYSNFDVYVSAATIPVFSWVHIAVTRSASTLRVFINGTLDGSVTYAQNLSDQSFLLGVNRGGSVGSIGTGFFNGYISNLRILKGTALYTANFTPPTAPLTAITNTSLLLNFTNAGIVDSAAKNNLETVGNAQISTAQSKFGGSSIYLDGTGDWLTVPDINDWSFAGDFTIETWVYPTSLGAERIIISQWFGGTVSNTAFTIDFQSTSRIRVVFTSGTTQAAINSASTYTANSWYHIAVVRSGSTITLYVNGTSQGSVTLAGTINNIPYPLYIGALNNEGSIISSFLGYIDDLRITKYARYTSNFTPPTAPFPDI
jgi:hypothetical protein